MNTSAKFNALFRDVSVGALSALTNSILAFENIIVLMNGGDALAGIFTKVPSHVRISY